MPRRSEVAEIVVAGKKYSHWTTVSVTRAGNDPFPKAVFTVAAPAESAPNWSQLKLAIGDKCEVYLAGRKVIEDGRIIGRQPAYDAQQHALQISVSTNATVVARATVDSSKGEYKGFNLTQIANALLKPYGKTFSTKGDTEGMDKVFDKFNVQPGETVYDAICRLCRMRNVNLLADVAGNFVGFRLKNGPGANAELSEGKNILSASASFDYTGALSQIDVVGQRPGNDQHFGDDARTQTGTVKNPAVKQHAPLYIIAEQPGDQADMRMRAQHENGFMLAEQVQVSIVVQGWLKDNDKLWLEMIGDPLTVYSPMLFTNDRMVLAVQSVTSTQGPTGTLTALGLVLPQAYNGTEQIDTSAKSGGLPANLYSGTAA